MMWQNFRKLIVVFFTNLTIYLLNFFNFLKFALCSGLNNRNECKPIESNEELLNFHRSPIVWTSYVEPIARRSDPVYLGKDFPSIYKTSADAADNWNQRNERTRPKVLVCHDLAGNYRDDRFIGGSKKWDDYRFYHWAGIDYFCYFSHKYITIPPLTWINAAHQNGVLALGTFIVESVEGKKNISEVLQSEQHMQRVVESLVLVTKCHSFDGWLINIECNVNEVKVPLLVQFVSKLTARIHDEIPHGKVFWYDSVINTGVLKWQDELNEKNIGYFNQCDGILINYAWKSQNLENTAKIVNNHPELMTKIFIGLDVFGRGQVAKFHSHETVDKIKKYNFSTGVFAPAWTFERILDLGLNPFDPNGSDVCNAHFIRRNNQFWSLLWKYLYSTGPKTLPFYSSFCLGSGKRKFRDGVQMTNSPWFNLMEQEYQPSVPVEFNYHFDEAYRGGCCIRFTSNIDGLRLFVSDFDCEQNIIFSYAFKRSTPQIQVEFILNIINNDQQLMRVTCGDLLSYEAEEPTARKHLYPLRGNNLHKVITSLSERQEKLFATSQPINGWESRYFILKFDMAEREKCRIVDLGLAIEHRHWTQGDEVLLGAVHVHEGIQNDSLLLRDSDTIRSRNFIL